MVPLVFNYQVGNPNATFPPSLTVKSTDAGVSILSLAPTHKYVAFGLTSTPPLPPSSGYLQWTPTSEDILYVPTNSSNFVQVPYSEFQTINPTTVGGIGFVPAYYEYGYITSLSNFAPYTNLSYIPLIGTFITDIDLENIQLKYNGLYPVPPQIDFEYNFSLSSVSNLPTFPDTDPEYNLYGNNFPKTSIDNILIEADNLGETGGALNIANGGGQGNNDTFTPGGAGESAYNNLISKNWYVYYNSGGLPQLTSNNDATTIVNQWVTTTGVFGSGNVSTFNSALGTNYELLRQIEIADQVGVTYLYINSYVNTRQINFVNLGITNISVKYLYSLRYLTISFCNSLTDIEFAPYYKNLDYVVLQGNALSQSTINDVLQMLDRNGKTTGSAYLNGGTNASPSGTGITAAYNLIAKGWAVFTN